MRSILALFFFAGVAACSSDSFTPAPVADAGKDAPLADASDGGPGFCASQPPGYLFCDDFDTLGTGATGLDSNWVVTTENGGAVSRSSTRSLSPGFGFEATTRPGKSSATLYRNPNAGVAGRLTLSFAIYLTAGCNEAKAGVVLASLVAADTALSKAYFISLALADTKLALIESVLADAGSSSLPQPGNTVWPTDKWVRVVFDAELGGKTAHVSLDGGAAEDFQLKAQLALVSFPAASIGASTEANRATACTVNFDDVVFRINFK